MHFCSLKSWWSRMVWSIDLNVFAWPGGGCQISIWAFSRSWRVRNWDPLVSTKTLWMCWGRGTGLWGGMADVFKVLFEYWSGLSFRGPWVSVIRCFRFGYLEFSPW